jgi:DNA-binding beta-propeller fold protein YncE
VISPNGNYLYVTNYGSAPSNIDAYSIGTGGTLSPITSDISTIANPFGIAISPNGNYLYVANFGTNGQTGISIYSCSAGALVSRGYCNTDAHPQEIAISPDGNYLFVDSSGAKVLDVYTIGSTGALTATSASGQLCTGQSPYGMAIIAQ